MTSRSRPLWYPAIAITASSWIRQEVEQVEQQAGCDIDVMDSLPDSRRNARRRPMIIIGADLIGRVRKPLYCGGIVVVATLAPDDRRAIDHATRINAPHIVALPHGRQWLAEKLLQIMDSR